MSELHNKMHQKNRLQIRPIIVDLQGRDKVTVSQLNGYFDRDDLSENTPYIFDDKSHDH